MANARVQVLDEVFYGPETGWRLYLQRCRYVHDGGQLEDGFRFIWRRPNDEGNSLQAARGQARIPSLAVARELMSRADAAGWGHFDANNNDARFTK